MMNPQVPASVPVGLKEEYTGMTMAPQTLASFSFTTSTLQTLYPQLGPLTPAERKALITLARHQRLPFEDDRVLTLKTRPILSKIVEDFDGSVSLHSHLTPFGQAVNTLITSPYTAGMVIVLCLELPDDYDTDSIKVASWNKEMAASQTKRKPGKWNWDILLGNEHQDGRDVHPDFPALSPLQQKMSRRVDWFRKRLKGKRIFPHYTTRGVSHETSKWLLSRVFDKNSRIVKHGDRSSFMRRLNPRNVSSKDVVHYYIRTGCWPYGRVEMRQQWSTNLLQPRTYFAWGGSAIKSSTYVRSLFNDYVDLFSPCHRYNRVQPDWLSYPRPRPPGASFYFYDLTSFTSWFHEQVPLLNAMARSMDGVSVDLVSEGLTIKEADVGDLIRDYISEVNDFPEFYYDRDARGDGMPGSITSFVHLCAGFLGVPGNLVTCTLGHGLAAASVHIEETDLQDPGDDVGALKRDPMHGMDIVLAAQTVGELQTEKVYPGEEASVYLKRGVRLTNLGVSLTPMVIYPIPVLYMDPLSDDQRLRDLGRTFKVVEPDRLVPRACQILVTFYRDLFKLSGGIMSEDEKDVIFDFLRYLHAKVNLPEGGIFQGRPCGVEEESNITPGIKLKFPLDREFLEQDPDLLFAERFIEQMVIHDVSKVDITWDITDGLSRGQLLTVRSGRKWSFLRDMGYIEEIQKVAGERVILIGNEAKSAYLYSRKPPYTDYRVDEDVSVHQLVALGFTPDRGHDTIVFDEHASQDRLVEAEYRNPIPRKYRDWDRPTFGGIEADYDIEGRPVHMMSFSNDSMDLLDLY